MGMRKGSFVLYTSYKQHIDLLSVKEKAMLLDAIFDYANGEEVKLEGATEMAFSFIKAQMDRDAIKYEDTCEKRRESGSKGGAPKGNKNASKQPKQANGCFNNQNKQEQAKQADNDNDYDNDNDINLKEIKKKKPAPLKKKYGELANVLLTDEEYNKLVSEYGQELADHAIQFLDEYIADKGYKSKSNYSAIRRWVVEAVKERDLKVRNPLTQGSRAPNKFADFPQNNYDMTELEAQLLDN